MLSHKIRIVCIEESYGKGVRLEVDASENDVIVIKAYLKILGINARI